VSQQALSVPFFGGTVTEDTVNAVPRIFHALASRACLAFWAAHPQLDKGPNYQPFHRKSPQRIPIKDWMGPLQLLVSLPPDIANAQHRAGHDVFSA